MSGHHPAPGVNDATPIWYAEHHELARTLYASSARTAAVTPT